MRKLYETLDDLKAKCEKYTDWDNNYLDWDDYVSPRHFRSIYLGVSKHMLSTWKNTQPEYFNLIKEYEDKILAMLEIDMLRKSKTETKDERFNNLGHMFILKAYDREQYVPETNQEQLENKSPIVVEFQNTSGHKLSVLEAKVVEKDAVK